MAIGESRDEPTKDIQKIMDRIAGSTARNKKFADAVDSTSPEVVAALEQFTLDYGRNWLDESIPALGGATPRECCGRSDPSG